MRLQKYLAWCGLGSRRACEMLIERGEVTLNGAVVETHGVQVDPGRDRVEVNGRLCQPPLSCYLALNKPRGYICTSDDPEGRDTFHALLPASLPRVFSVGRLDCESEGLLLITNDGDWAHRVLHPRHDVVKVYHVWTRDPISSPALRDLRRGIRDHGEWLAVRSIQPRRQATAGNAYKVELNEGRNRHIRRMLEVVGASVIRLRRTRIGPVTVGSLKPGAYRKLTPREINAFGRRAIY